MLKTFNWVVQFSNLNLLSIDEFYTFNFRKAKGPTRSAGNSVYVIDDIANGNKRNSTAPLVATHESGRVNEAEIHSYSYVDTNVGHSVVVNPEHFQLERPLGVPNSGFDMQTSVGPENIHAETELYDQVGGQQGYDRIDRNAKTGNPQENGDDGTYHHIQDRPSARSMPVANDQDYEHLNIDGM